MRISTGSNTTTMGDLAIQEVDDAVVFSVKVVPGSSKTDISGLFNGMLKIKVSAAPEKGRATKCLLEFLAKRAGVRRNSVSLVSGRTSPVKKVQILGISRRALLERLNLDDKSLADDR